MPEVDNELYRQITVSGSDTIEFLQGQFTQDLVLLKNAGQLLAAWCNPKGRVITTVRLISLGSDIGVVLPASITEAVLKRLAMYRLRAKVQFTVEDNAWEQAIRSEDADPQALILAGVPTIDETNSEKYTPHMLNLDKLSAISFSKGCYTGQEVVARTENLGKSKRRLMRYLADEDGIIVGDKISQDERSVGEVVNVFGRDFLAVTPVELHKFNLTVNKQAATPQGLPYSI